MKAPLMMMLKENELHLIDDEEYFYCFNFCCVISFLPFSSSVTHTFVNGVLMYNEGTFNDDVKGKRITFNR